MNNYTGSPEQLTQARLKELLHYNSETGLFTRLIAVSNRVKVGDTAGWKNGRGYISIRVDWVNYQAHRLAWLYMTGKWPEFQIDHINHIFDDNRWLNFREVTQQENSRNQPLSLRNKSGVPGVGWHKCTGKWYANITVDRIHKYLGVFSDFFEAVCARKSAERKYGFHVNHGMKLCVS